MIILLCLAIISKYIIKKYLLILKCTFHRYTYLISLKKSLLKFLFVQFYFDLKKVKNSQIVRFTIFIFIHIFYYIFQ